MGDWCHCGRSAGPPPRPRLHLGAAPEEAAQGGDVATSHQAAQLRSKMQSRIIRPGGRTFTVGGGKGLDDAEMMALLSSANNLYSYAGYTGDNGSVSMSRPDSYSQFNNPYGGGAESPYNGSFTMDRSASRGPGAFAGNVNANGGGMPGVYNPGLPANPVSYGVGGGVGAAVEHERSPSGKL